MNVLSFVTGHLIDKKLMELDKAIEILNNIFQQINYTTNQKWANIEHYSEGGEIFGNLQVGFSDNVTWPSFVELLRVTGLIERFL